MTSSVKPLSIIVKTCAVRGLIHQALNFSLSHPTFSLPLSSQTATDTPMSKILQLTEEAINLITKGDLEKAKSIALQLNGLKPTSAEEFNHLGLLYYNFLQLRPAIPCFQQAIAIEPNEVAYLNNLALCHLKLAENAVAAKLLLKALKINPNHAMSYYNLGVVFQNNHNLAKALEYFELSYSKNPQVISPLTAMANILEKMGRVDEAEALCRRILKQQPDHAQANIQLGSLLRNRKDFPKALEALDIALTHQAHSAELHYERGHVLQALGRFPEALNSFKTANRYQDKKFYTKDHFKKEIDELKEFYTALAEQNLAPTETNPKQPLYVVGSPRSGTTLLAQMLDMHPNIISCGELEVTRDTVRQINQSLNAPNNLKVIFEHLWFHASKSDINLWRENYLKSLALHPQYDPSKVLLDKLPSNARRIALIAKLFPGAPVIHIIRDGREVAFSSFSQNFQNYVWHSHNVFDSLLEWQSTIDLSRLGAKATGCPYLEVRYEQLVQNPKDTLTEILAFLKQPWHEDCLRFQENPNQTYTASYNQVRKKIYTDSIHKAKNYPELYQEMTEFAEQKLNELEYLQPSP